MLDEIKKRRKLQDKVEELTREWLRLKPQSSDSAQLNSEARSHLLKQQQQAKHKLDVFESNILVNKARRLGIEIPYKAEWWEDDYDEEAHRGIPSDVLNDLINRWLSPTGRLMVTKMIRDEHRKNIEWWIKIATPLLGALISLLGLIVALVTVAKK